MRLHTSSLAVLFLLTLLASQRSFAQAVEHSPPGVQSPPPFAPGPASIRSTRFGADWMWRSGSNDGSFQGGGWQGNRHAGIIVSKTFEGFLADPVEGPYPAFLSTAFTNGTGPQGDGVAVMGIATAQRPRDVAFGFNFIAAAGFNIDGARLVGGEIDVQAQPGRSVANGSAGLYINAFNALNMGSAIQIEGIEGGYFTNGVKIGQLNPEFGAALSLSGPVTIGSLVNTTVGNYTQAGVELGAGMMPGIRLRGPSAGEADSARIFNENGYLVVRQGDQPILFQDHAGNPIATLGRDGALNLISATAVLMIDGAPVVGRRGPAIDAPQGGAVVDAEARQVLLAILSQMRADGKIAQ